MSVIIKTGDGISPAFEVKATLDGVTYTLQFRWNVRQSAWFMSVFDADGVVPLMAGLRLVANWFLGKYNVPRNPPGAFVALDTSGAALDPAFEDLGSRVQLVYIPVAERRF